MAATAQAKRTKTNKAAPKPSPRVAADTGFPAIKVDHRRALSLVLELMPIPGKSGEEAAVAKFIKDRLRAAGVPTSRIRHDNAHRRSPLQGEVGNLIVQFPGTLRTPRRLLMAHMDTVPLCVGTRPVRKGDFIKSGNPATGLGADDRAGVAVVLNTALEILTRKLPHPPLTFLFAVQEEVGLHGAHFVQTGLLGKPRLAFNWDGGPADKLTIGATGGYRLSIDIAGLAAHAGGAPEQGISAVAIASLAVAQLVRDRWHGLVEKDGKRGTSNVGVINGGAATNVVADHVQIKAEARSHDPAFRKEIVRQIERAFQEAALAVRNAKGESGKVKIDGRLDYESFKLAGDDPSVAAADRAVRASGLEPQLAISNGGLDANWMTVHGIPTVTLGCGQMNIHTTAEQLEIKAFQKACEIALRVALEP